MLYDVFGKIINFKENLIKKEKNKGLTDVFN